MGIKKLFSWLFNHLDAVLILFGLLGGIVVVVVSWLSSIPSYQLLLIILFVLLGGFALVFLGLNQLRIFRAGKGKRVTELNDKEFEKTIRDWLDDPLFKFQRKDDPKYLFMFVVTDEQGRPITISRKISKPAQLHLATAITLGKEHRKTYDTLSYYEKEKILYNLRIEMARYGIGYSGIEMELKRVVLTDTVLLDDSLTEFYLKQRIFYVTGAFILYGQRISQQLMSSGEQEMHKEDSQS